MLKMTIEHFELSQRQLKDTAQINHTYQAIANMLNELLSSRTVRDSFDKLTHDEANSILLQYDSLLCDVEQINKGIMSALKKDETALKTLDEFIKELREVKNGTA